MNAESKSVRSFRVYHCFTASNTILAQRTEIVDAMPK